MQMQGCLKYDALEKLDLFNEGEKEKRNSVAQTAFYASDFWLLRIENRRSACYNCQTDNSYTYEQMHLKEAQTDELPHQIYIFLNSEGSPSTLCYSGNLQKTDLKCIPSEKYCFPILLFRLNPELALRERIGFLCYLVILTSLLVRIGEF